MPPNTTTSSRPPQVDAVKLSRSLIILLLFLMTVVAGFLTIRSGSSIMIIGMLALPFVLILMNKPQVALVLAVVMDATAFKIPGMALGTIGLFAKLLLLGSALLSFLLGQKMWNQGVVKEKKPLILFAGVIFSLMAVRGAGLRMLGSETWGGMMYINLLIGMLIFYVLNGLTIERKHLFWIIWGSLVAGLFGSYIQYKGYSSTSATMSDVSASRLAFLIPFVYGLFPFACAVTWKNKGIGVLLILLSVALMALTGFRSRLVGLLAVSVGFGFFLAKYKLRYCFTVLLVGLMGWGLLIAISSHVPLGIQRSISFVPGVHVEDAASKNALESIEWRVEIWKYCWSQVPEYLWVGRGSTFNVWETSENLSGSDIATFSPWFAFLTRSYHSGPLSLLLDYGMAGFLVGSAILVAFFKRFWGYAVRISCIKSFEARYALLLCVMLLWRFFSFYAVYGDMRGFASIIADAAVAMVICSSVLKEKNDTHCMVD